MPRPDWTKKPPLDGHFYMIFRKPWLRQKGLWHGYLYRGEGWSELIKDGWVRAVSSVQDQCRGMRPDKLERVPPEVKN